MSSTTATDTLAPERNIAIHCLHVLDTAQLTSPKYHQAVPPLRCSSSKTHGCTALHLRGTCNLWHRAFDCMRSMSKQKILPDVISDSSLLNLVMLLVQYLGTIVPVQRSITRTKLKKRRYKSAGKQQQSEGSLALDVAGVSNTWVDEHPHQFCSVFGIMESQKSHGKSSALLPFGVVGRYTIDKPS